MFDRLGSAYVSETLCFAGNFIKVDWMANRICKVSKRFFAFVENDYGKYSRKYVSSKFNLYQLL